MKINSIELAALPPREEIRNWPEFKGADYQRRIGRTLQMASARALTHVVVYGDREHYSNLYFLTGYDPRFEEALLILSADHDPVLVVGNEGMSYSEISPVSLKRVLYQSFSLVGQPRSISTDLAGIFRSAGVSRSSAVGVVGWKYGTGAETARLGEMIDAPHYIVSCLQDVVGKGKIVNATDIMLDPVNGLRAILDANELVAQEVAGSRSSDCVRNVLQNLKPGISELEASSFFDADGEPVSAHPLVNFGTRNVLMGLCSPGLCRLTSGQVISVAFGYRRAMNARTGLYNAGKGDIPSEMRGIVDKFYSPYFSVLARWYESLCVGITGGEVYAAANGEGQSLTSLGVALNPGHLIHTDEWTNSIFFEGSKYKVASGMAIQCDIIAFPGNGFVGVHVEDGVLVADEPMRKQIISSFPDCWQRIAKRRKFMKDILGVRLSEDILPVSNIQALLHPNMSDLKVVLSKA